MDANALESCQSEILFESQVTCFTLYTGMNHGESDTQSFKEKGLCCL